ncbi:MAG: PAS domain S-box protein [Symploca sp. SIO2G7]|nr:PAS domain S-box protein [Symploca sp. SIO2G7]
MISKVIKFHFPEELTQVIEERAKITNKSQDTLIVEALATAFGLPLSSLEPIASEMVSQQLQEIIEQATTLSQRLVKFCQETDLDSSTLRHLAFLVQAVESFRILGISNAAEPKTSLLVRNQHRELRTTVKREDNQGAKILDQIISTFPGLIFVLDRMGRFTYINSVGTHVLGFERNHFVGKTFAEVNFPIEPREQFLEQYQSVLTTGKFLSEEFNLLTIQGTRNYEYILNPIQGSGRHPDAVVCIARDITEHKQIAIALQESERKYRNLFELANDLIMIIDANTQQLLDVNFNAARRLGYTRRELLQLSISDIETPMAATRYQVLQQKLKHIGYINYEHSLRCKEGTEIPVEISTQIIEYEGQLVFQYFARDIEKYRKAEVALKQLNKELEIRLKEQTAQLQESEERFRNIVNQIEK